MIAAINSSTVISACASIALMAFFADLIIDSCAPPKCGASGELKCHFTPLFPTAALILLSSSSDNSILSSLLAPLKFVPLSDNISSGSPRRLAIL